MMIPAENDLHDELWETIVEMVSVLFFLFENGVAISV
jgi:hypothetical protein